MSADRVVNSECNLADAETSYLHMGSEQPWPDENAVISLLFVLGPQHCCGDLPAQDPEAYRDVTLDAIARCDYIWEIGIEKRS